jgi:hypothetical protein
LKEINEEDDDFEKFMKENEMKLQDESFLKLKNQLESIEEKLKKFQRVVIQKAEK